jgi:hypothetical protein
LKSAPHDKEGTADGELWELRGIYVVDARLDESPNEIPIDCDAIPWWGVI